MLNILDQINQWIKDFLISCITGNLSGLFGDINIKVGEIATETGKTPQDWNSTVFNMVKSLSESVIIPIAGIVITFVLTYELISMITEKNNLHDFEISTLFKWIIKVFIATYIVTHTFDITMAIFEVSKNVVEQSGSFLTVSNTALDFDAVLGDLAAQLPTMEIGALFGLLLESILMKAMLFALTIVIELVLMGRMIEIYVYCSIGAIPFATMVNREWGQMGSNYLRGLVALGLQGFFIMVCVAIYSVLISTIGTADSIHAAMLSCMCYTVLLGYTLLKTGSISKSIFNAH